jgi:predicted O-methyltransferase YrrM
VIINRLLRLINLRLTTLTVEKAERTRLLTMKKAGYFDAPAFPLLPAISQTNPAPILENTRKYLQRFNDFEDKALNEVGYVFDNDWFTSPDAEVLYTVIREHQPNRIVEVGSGFSTKIMRQAITDGDLRSELISIDPLPRTDIAGLADQIYAVRAEAMRDSPIFSSLQVSDILFIDSSHEIKSGNDVLFLFLDLLPKLRPGVLVHVHDVFLPYEYPAEWVIDGGWGWNEQYLVQALLSGRSFEVIWPGHFLQRTGYDFSELFPHSRGRRAQSLWLRKLPQS